MKMRLTSLTVIAVLMSPQVHIEIAFGESSRHHSRRGLRNRWERMRTPGHILPPYRTTTAGLRDMEGEYNPWRWPLRINQQSQL
jgi:hypothetical protein